MRQPRKPNKKKAIAWKKHLIDLMVTSRSFPKKLRQRVIWGLEQLSIADFMHLSIDLHINELLCFVTIMIVEHPKTVGISDKPNETRRDFEMKSFKIDKSKYVKSSDKRTIYNYTKITQKVYRETFQEIVNHSFPDRYGWLRDEKMESYLLSLE